jgi:hypothetical protein
MARVFNSIRQRLLKEDRLTRYLVYAVGEILLVVIGILIALQLNLLKEERNQRRQEVQTLEQLRDEFTSNLVQLDEKISMRESMMRSALQLLAYHDDTTLVVTDSVETFIARTTVSPTFDPVTNDLITAGRLYLISNLALRRKLSTWSSEVVQVTEEEVSWIHMRRQIYDPFLRAHYPMRNVHVAKWSGLDVVRTLLLDKENAGNLNMDLARSKRQPDLTTFFSHPELEDHLSRIVSATLFANRQSEALRKSIVEILELIDDELKEN